MILLVGLGDATVFRYGITSYCVGKCFRNHLQNFQLSVRELILCYQDNTYFDVFVTCFHIFCVRALMYNSYIIITEIVMCVIVAPLMTNTYI